MCESKADGGRRCPGNCKYQVNRESSPQWAPDVTQERHTQKPEHLLSMKKGTIAVRRCRAAKKIAEVDAVRTVHGIAPGAPIGPVIREELWAARCQGTALSLHALAARFKAIAADEGISVAQVAARYECEQVKPHRQSAGQRLADLVLDPTRADWVDENYLVQCIEPTENGTPNAIYLRIVKDADEREWLLLTSFDGSEAEVWPNTRAGLKAAGWEAIQRARAVADDSSAYDSWLSEKDAGPGDGTSPYTQSMTEADFLSHHDEMHLV